VLADGARLVVVSGHPSAQPRSVVETDLAPGRPLHPETWQYLLDARGFRNVEVRVERLEGTLPIVPGEGEANRILNANLAQLGATLFAPTSFLVTAVRARW
jgi:hypothetical protein